MKNWRTTITGLLSAAGLVVVNLIQTGTVDPKTLAIAAALAILGALAKDAQVTGGTIGQTGEAANRVEAAKTSMPTK